MEKRRCRWCNDNALLTQYHDEEWGVPVFDDRKLFEFITLEGAQAGLNWLTILQRREFYRQELDQFDVNKIARYSAKKMASMLENPRLIRNRLKLQSVVKNAQAFLTVQEQFANFAEYIWQFVDGQPKDGRLKKDQSPPSSSKESDSMSKDLKKRGFSFVGSTICYAFMQAMGMVNDHNRDCFRYLEIVAHGK